MFSKSYEERLAIWSQFRSKIETSNNPLQDVIDFYKPAPTVSINTDPWTKEYWPNPWELIHENQYCDFCRVLGYCFSLQLTDRFKEKNFEIHIVTNDELGYEYLLFVDDSWVLGYDKNKPIHVTDIAEKLNSQVVYQMPPLQ